MFKLHLLSLQAVPYSMVTPSLKSTFCLHLIQKSNLYYLRQIDSALESINNAFYYHKQKIS